jgi:hypothetical protein
MFHDFQVCSLASAGSNSLKLIICSFVECLFLLEEVATIVQLKLTKVYRRFLLLFCLNFSKSQ